MATGKRYFWIKLKETFMTSDAVDFLMGQPDGANYVVLYQMLCLKTINTDGRLSRRIGEIIIPYDEQKIARDTKWFSVDTVRVALNLYKALGLVYQETDGSLVLTDHANLVGSETDYAEKNRRLRSNQSILPTGHNVSENVSTNVSDVVSENVSTDIDIDIRDKDIEDKDNNNSHKEGNSSIDIGAEKNSDFPQIILNDGTYFIIPNDYYEKLKPLFPDVNIKKELRKMSAWCLSNPAKRKTRRGITRFINSWLSSEQDRVEKQKANDSGTNNIFLQIAEERHDNR